MFTPKMIYGNKFCVDCNSELNVFSEREFETETKCAKCKRPKFTCRICGHDEYEAIYPSMSGSTMIGGRSFPTHYKCIGCSIIFEDPKLFSVYKNIGLKNKK